MDRMQALHTSDRQRASTKWSEIERIHSLALFVQSFPMLSAFVNAKGTLKHHLLTQQNQTSFFCCTRKHTHTHHPTIDLVCDFIFCYINFWWKSFRTKAEIFSHKLKIEVVKKKKVWIVWKTSYEKFDFLFEVYSIFYIIVVSME